MRKQPNFRWFILLSLLGMVLLAIAPLQGASARPFDQTKRNRSTLCGRLVFLEDYKTGAKMIGLIPCNENRPIIFAAGPAELYDFYRFTNVVIKKGDKVTTLNYGTLENYITRFDSYKQISSCRDCDPNAAGFQPPSADQAGDCSEWVLDQAATAFPALNLAQDLETMLQNLQAYAGGEVATRQCGVDRDCRIGAVAQQLGVQLGPRLNWGGITTQQVIAWLASLLSDPTTVESCASIETVAPSLVVGLNQQGYGIDLAAIGENCDLLATDQQGRKVGFEDGSTLEQALEAKAVSAPQGQYLLWPTGIESKLDLACTKGDYVNLQMVLRGATGIYQSVFSRLPVRNRTHGEIDLLTLPPVLSLDPQGNGNPRAYEPNRRLLHPPLVALLASPTPTGTPASPSATPSASPTPEATPTPSATPLPPSPTIAPTEPPTPTPLPPSGPAGLCPLAFGVALLPGVIWWRRRASARQSTTSY